MDLLDSYILREHRFGTDNKGRAVYRVGLGWVSNPVQLDHKGDAPGMVLDASLTLVDDTGPLVHIVTLAQDTGVAILVKSTFTETLAGAVRSGGVLGLVISEHMEAN